MSNPGIPQNPYGQPAPSAPTAYPQQPARASASVDRGVVRQILFGGSVVLGIAIVTNILLTIGNSVFGFVGEQIFGLLWSIFIALVFIAGAGLSALYIAPFARATSTQDLIRRLAIAGLVGAAALLVLNFIWSVINGGQYLVQMILSSGILGSISTGLTYGAFFALGVFIARALPASPRPAYGPAQAQGYPPQGYGQPQGYPQQPSPYPAGQPVYTQPQAPAQHQGHPGQQQPAPPHQ